MRISILVSAMALAIPLGSLAAVPADGSSSARPAASLTGPAGAPSVEQDVAGPSAGEALYWKIDARRSIRGLIAVSRASPDDDLVISFHLWGLRPRTSYVLYGSPGRCSEAAGSPIFERGFRTDRRGLIWDPVGSPGSLEEIRSVRIRRAGSSREGRCVNSGPVSTGALDPDSMKCSIRLAHRCLVVVDESDGRRTLVSLSGLRAGVRHSVVLRSGTCPDGGDVLTRYSFRPDADGRAIVDRVEVADAGQQPSGPLPGGVASIALKRAGAILDCVSLDGAPPLVRSGNGTTPVA